MSNQPENDLFNLDNLFAPAWAKEPAEANRYAKYEGREDNFNRGERRGGQRGFGGPRREGGPRPPRGPRPEGGRGPGAPRLGGDRRRGDRHPQGRGPRQEERPAPQPLPEVNLALVPDSAGVDLLARQIKMTGRAYPLFQIALMILEKPERHAATYSVKKNPEGQPMQSLFGCALDESLWLTEDEVVKHVLAHHLETFYQAERTQTEPPKGKYTFVAQCGMSGIILGPPNHHDYQRKLQELHTERFSRMPFDQFKSRVKIVKDEAVVAKWIDEQSWRTEYICLNIPDAPKLSSMEDVENHFRAVHAPNIVKPVETITLSGKACRNLRCSGLARVYRVALENQRRFPLQIATVLSQQFAQHGLQFFKVNKTVTHVWVARPKYLDLETTPVSDGVRKIVEFIDAHPKCTRRDLVESLAPTPAKETPAPAPASEGTPAPEGSAAPTTPAAEPTAEQTAVVSDLHWLIHQGHVIEFATSGILETAKKPVPKPPKPEPKKEAAPNPAAKTVPSPGEAPATAAPADASAQPPSEAASAPKPASAPATEAVPAPAPTEATAASTEPAAQPPAPESPERPADQTQAGSPL